MSERQPDDAIEFTSRYDVLGPPNGCKGVCEGAGLIPHWHQNAQTTPIQAYHHRDDEEPPIYRVLWFLAEAKQETDDGWHFIPCPDCRSGDVLVQLAHQFLRGR